MINDTPHSLDAQRALSPRTLAPRHTSNNPSQGSHNPLSLVRQKEHAWISSSNYVATRIDTTIVTPFSSNAGLISAASARPGYMAKREEKKKFVRYPRINLALFILESTGRPCYHARKFIKHLYDDTDHPPTAIRDAWAAIQTTLQNSISKQQLRAVTT